MSLHQNGTNIKIESMSHLRAGQGKSAYYDLPKKTFSQHKDATRLAQLTMSMQTFENTKVRSQLVQAKPTW